MIFIDTEKELFWHRQLRLPEDMDREEKHIRAGAAETLCHFYISEDVQNTPSEKVMEFHGLLQIVREADLSLLRDAKAELEAAEKAFRAAMVEQAGKLRAALLIADEEDSP